MKKFLITFMLLFVAIVSISAKGNNKRIIVTTTPQMHCQSCEEKIMGNIRFVKGVKIIQTSIAQQTVTITYDSTKCSYKDIEKAFKKIKYSIKEVDPKALPSCCEGEAKGGKADCHKDNGSKANAKCDKKAECDKSKDCCGKNCDNKKDCDKKCEKSDKSNKAAKLKK